VFMVRKPSAAVALEHVVAAAAKWLPQQPMNAVLRCH
jgi:hypothetical protein